MLRLSDICNGWELAMVYTKVLLLLRILRMMLARAIAPRAALLWVLIIKMRLRGL